jgi:hypothetical protein
VYNTERPSKVWFALPETILEELKLFSSTNEPIQIPASPGRTASLGRACVIDLRSDDELDLITRHRTAACDT